MNELKDYIKIYNLTPEDVCKTTVQELQDADFDSHKFYNVKDGSYDIHTKDLAVAYCDTSTKEKLMKIIWDAVAKYILTDFKSDYFDGWSGFTEVRFNKYDVNTEMRLHCDHIHDMFDGSRKGIPKLSIVGILNDDFKGGEFIMFEDSKIELKIGDIMIFPSCFLYPHKVNEITEGTRYSFVSWVW